MIIKRFSRLVMRELEPSKDIYALNRNIAFEKNLQDVEKDPSGKNIGKLVAQTTWDQTVGKEIDKGLSNLLRNKRSGN